MIYCISYLSAKVKNWSLQEAELIIDTFKSDIVKKKIPSKGDIVRFLEESGMEGQVEKRLRFPPMVEQKNFCKINY